ncbi:unnamed protein product [Caenorhabditis angaria]|uniref:Uncharacterized protein n=1 Tax=Caenorhabditis angaria TaxID=860376 RepID=A0A9P1IKN0_9PELO|nr:unnamed protein product [Caenorhabditis angaria]
MFDLAPELNAAVVFVEHRYYGNSKPFGNQSFSSVENLGYLSSSQALADYAFVVQHLKNGKTIPGADENTAVIAIGGSYGGMLSAWLRMKYPHIIDGAISSSAPLLFFNSKQTDHSQITTRTFVDAGCNRKAIETGWEVLDKLAKTKAGRGKLNKIFKLDPKKSLISKKEDVKNLKEYVKEAMTRLSYVNYPYPTHFLEKVPGWPVKKVCEKIRKIETSDEKTAEQLYNIVNLYYNYTGDKKFLCANTENCGDGYSIGWPFHRCTEMIILLCSKGPPNDFFWNNCPDSYEKRTLWCKSKFESLGYETRMMRPNNIVDLFGSPDSSTTSNIVFTNGDLDPWAAYGFTEEKLNGSIKSIIFKNGAHHYDLRGTHELDTKEVKQVRIFEKNEIRKWIKEKNMKKNHEII